MSDRESISDGWTRLRQGAAVSSDFEIPTIRRRTDSGFGFVRLALGVQGEARLLVPLADRATAPELPRFNELGISVRRLAGPRGSSRFIDIECRSAQLESVFSEVCEKITTRIEQGASARDACQTTVTEFRALLESEGGRAVDEALIRGLLGELLTLEALVARNSRAIALWRGPMGDRHDFRAGSNAIEVKTSARANSPIIISSIGQLEAPSDGRLYLVRHVLETSASGDLTISKVSSRILSTIGEKNVFLECLALLGCESPDSRRWNETSFNYEGVSVFQVDERFPKITSQSFAAGKPPGGIRSLNYGVDLSFARDCQLDDQDWKTVREGILSCL